MSAISKLPLLSTRIDAGFEERIIRVVESLTPTAVKGSIVVAGQAAVVVTRHRSVAQIAHDQIAVGGKRESAGNRHLAEDESRRASAIVPEADIAAWGN